MAEIIAIANQKGGVGKTTTAINLAAGVAALGNETLLIDMDPQGNATSGLGFDKAAYSPNIYEVLVELLPLEKTIKASAVENLSVAGSNSALTGAEIELTKALAREDRLRGAVAAVQQRYRYIFIDCPPALGLLTVNALTAADRVIIPIQGEYYAMEGLAQFIDAINRVQQSLNARLTVEGGLLTMFDSRMTLSNQVKEEVFRFFGPAMFNTIIPRNIRLAEAPGFGQSILHYDPRSRGAEAYIALAQEFIGRRSHPKVELLPQPQAAAEKTMESIS
jgi:chromosome partitioning protein